MLCYLDRTFCAAKDCKHLDCKLNQNNIPWDKLPEWMCVSVTDFQNRCERCAKVDTKEAREKNE